MMGVTVIVSKEEREFLNKIYDRTKRENGKYPDSTVSAEEAQMLIFFSNRLLGVLKVGFGARIALLGLSEVENPSSVPVAEPSSDR